MNIKIALLIILILVFILKAKPMTKKSQLSHAGDAQYIKDSFRIVYSEYPASIMENIEKIYRLETAHFTSGQYLASFSAGMVHSIDGKPLGWKFSNIKGYVGESRPFEVGGKTYTYVVFDTLPNALRFLGDYIKKYGAYRWYSTLPAAKEHYKNLLSAITPRIVNELKLIA